MFDTILNGKEDQHVAQVILKHIYVYTSVVVHSYYRYKKLIIIYYKCTVYTSTNSDIIMIFIASWYDKKLKKCPIRDNLEK